MKETTVDRAEDCDQFANTTIFTHHQKEKKREEDAGRADN